MYHIMTYREWDLQEQGVGPLPALFPFLLSPQFSRDQNLRSHVTYSTSLARERLLRRLPTTELKRFTLIAYR